MYWPSQQMDHKRENSSTAGTITEEERHEAVIKVAIPFWLVLIGEWHTNIIRRGKGNVHRVHL
jgi:hypothetical protein